VTRRAVLLMAGGILAFADERTEVFEIVSPLASALSNGDAEEFLRRIPADVPDRIQLANNVRALLAQAEMTCSIQLRSYKEGRAELDWYMEIRSRATASVMEQRKSIVTVRLRDRQISSIEPVDFFRPAKAR
jgi:hypothetical protein